MWPQHLHGADPGPGAAVLQHHADAGEQRAALALRVEPEHRARALLRLAVALAGLQRRRLAGAVGAEDRGDRAASTVRSRPSTATLSPYRMTGPVTATAARGVVASGEGARPGF